MKCIGIDLGHYSIKIFEVNNSPNGLQLLNYREDTLNPDPASDNQISILDTLRSLTAVNDPATTKYIVCVPQSQVSTRYKFFPFKERSKVLKSIPFELEDDIPLDQEEAIFEAKFVRYRGSTCEVLASACPIEKVKAVLNIFKEAGIDPDIVSAEGLAMANLVEDFNNAPPQESLPKAVDLDEESNENQEEKEEIPEKEQGHLLLNIGHTKTILAAFRGFNLVYVRSIEWGGRNLAQSIARKYNISYQEAVKEVESKSFILTSPEGASRDQIIFSNLIAGSVNELIRELKLSIIDIQAEFNLNLTHLSLTGGGSQIRNLGAYLTKAVEFPCNSLDYLNRFAEVFIERTPQVLAQAGIALSLAIEGTKRPINPPTNFRKDLLGKQSQVFKHFWLRWGGALKMAAIAFVAFSIYAIVKDQIASHLAETTRDSLKKKAKVVGVNRTTTRNIKKFIRQKQNDLKHRDQLLKLNGINSALDLLALVSQTVPKKKPNNIELNVSHFKVAVDKISLKGTVKKRESLSLLEESLRAVAVDQKIRRLAVAANSQGIPFSYELTVDRKIPLNSGTQNKKTRLKKKRSEK